MDISLRDFPAEFAKPAEDCVTACLPYFPPEIECVVLRYQSLPEDGDTEVCAHADPSWKYREAQIVLYARFFMFEGNDRLEMMLHEITHIHNCQHDRLIGSRVLPRVPAAARPLMEELIEDADEHRVQGIARGIVRLLCAFSEKETEDMDESPSPPAARVCRPGDPAA